MERENGNSIVRVSLSISNIDHSDDDAGDGSWNYCFSAYNKISWFGDADRLWITIMAVWNAVAYGLRLVLKNIWRFICWIQWRRSSLHSAIFFSEQDIFMQDTMEWGGETQWSYLYLELCYSIKWKEHLWIPFKENRMAEKQIMVKIDHDIKRI